MFKKIVLLGCLVGAVVTHASNPSHCGDGNRQYRMDPNKKEVIYYANIGEFTLRRVAENKVKVADSVNCRYGEDTLIDLERVVFLDKIISVEDLAIQAEITTLSVDTLKALLFEKLFAQILAMGVNPNNPEKIEEEKNDRDTITASGSGQSSTVYVPAASVGFDSNGVYSGSNYSLPSQSQYTATANQNVTPSSANYLPAYNPYNTYVSSSYTGYPTYNPYYSSVAQPVGYVNPVPSAPVVNQVTVPVTWDASVLDPRAIVYFEATDADSTHHYLGSAIASQVSDTVSVPNSLFAKGQVTLSVKTGNRVLNSFNVQLQ